LAAHRAPMAQGRGSTKADPFEMTPGFVGRCSFLQAPDVGGLRFALSDQGASGFSQEVPGFAVLLVAVAILSERGHGTDRYPDLARWSEQDCGGDQVPDFFWDDVRREYVEFIDAVRVFDQPVASELAQVSGAIADAAGLDLHSKHVAAMFYGDVVFERVPAGFEYVISVRGGIGHELQFDPFASLLERSELLPILHPRSHLKSVGRRWSLVVSLTNSYLGQPIGLRPQ